MYRLIFLTGSMKGRRLAVQQGSLLIGRDPSCQLDLADDDEVSRQHAIIEQRPDGDYVRDLGPTNPTEVNGKPIKEWKLRQDDKIEVGRTVMQYQVIDEYKSGARRSVSLLHMLTVGAIALLLLGQVAYWLSAPRWQKETGQPVAAAQPAVESAPTSVSNEPPAPKDDLQIELENAVAQAEKEHAATVTPPAPAVETTNAEAMFSQVADIRKDLVEIRKQVQDLSTPGATSAPPVALVEPRPAPPEAHATSTPPPSNAPPAAVAAAAEPAPAPVATNVAPPAPEKSREDILVERARDMLTEALVEQQKHNLVQADTIIERIQVMAPDFVPAYVERARLYESRGMLKKAGEQWSQVLTRATGTPLYEQAAAERQRLARAEIVMSMTRDSPATPAQASATRLPRRIRILDIEREKFEANRDYDEMRITRATIKARPSEGDVDTDDFAAVFTFYDRNLTTGTVAPSRAVVPEGPTRVEGLWRSGDEKTVTAAYILPKGFRAREEKDHGERHAYEGVRIQLYYRDELQDEDAVPKSLLALEAPAYHKNDDLNAPVGR